MIKHLALLCLALPCRLPCLALEPAAAAATLEVTDAASAGSFAIAAPGAVAPLLVDSADHPGVLLAADDVAADIGRVCGRPSTVRHAAEPASGCIVAGTIGHSRPIDRLIAQGRLDASAIAGQWEAYTTATIDGMLVVAGSDKRGTIYGLYHLSERMGVSPWHWWADAPPRHREALYVPPVKAVQPPPKVKYRGLFINDEEPSFGTWARQHFGGFNAAMYDHLFELLLRLRANYLWPAMWGSAFNEDDPANPRRANERGLVMGTSHHEPMMRAHQEYARRREQLGPWDYTTNKSNLDRFFAEGLARNGAYDNLVTIGMRGDGDVALGARFDPARQAAAEPDDRPGDPDRAAMTTLAEVIKAQRALIEAARRARGKDAAAPPQLWAIFTEVQRYYDKGFTVPDDVLLLFCDNNWGYLRRTGPAGERHPMGLYYHIDMNGGPWNDRWVNTTTIPKLREQLNLAYRTGLDDLWVVNVGDLKPKELPIDFILRYAWDPDAVGPGDEAAYTRGWAASLFGPEHANEIADLAARYAKYNLWRKPEVQDAGIFSVVNHDEADRVLSLWRDLSHRADSLRRLIPEPLQDAFFQLVYYPVKASAGVAEIWLLAGQNHLYARQGRKRANACAERARQLFEQDGRLAAYYNDSLAGGKWSGMMSDVHMGYTSWQMPAEPRLPDLHTVRADGPASLRVAVEGDTLAYGPGTPARPELPPFDAWRPRTRHIDLFNAGAGTVPYTATSSAPWVRLSRTSGQVSDEERVTVSVDYAAAPAGTTLATIDIDDGRRRLPVTVSVTNIPPPSGVTAGAPWYGSSAPDEYAVPAEGYARNVPGTHCQWIELPDLGRHEACMGGWPVNAPSANSTDEAPRLEYQIYVPECCAHRVSIGILPTQDVNPARGLRLGVGLDEEVPIVLDARQGLHDEFAEYTADNLSRSPKLRALPGRSSLPALLGQGRPRRNEVFDNMRWLTVSFNFDGPGMHTLKLYLVDPEVVVQRIVVDPDDRHPSYFGAEPWSPAAKQH